MTPRPATIAAAALSICIIAGCTASPASTDSKAPAPATTQPAYTVAATWPSDGSIGAGATLIVPAGSESLGRAAIRQYIRANARGEYLWVEVLPRPDADEWLCAGEHLSSSADAQYAVFAASRAAVTYPADWVECR